MKAILASALALGLATPAAAQGIPVMGPYPEDALRYAQEALRGRDFLADQARRDRVFEREQQRMAEERDRTRRDVRRGMDERDPERRR